MKTFIKTTLALCALALAGCGDAYDEPAPVAQTTKLRMGKSAVTLYDADTNLVQLSVVGRCQVVPEAPEQEQEAVEITLLCQIGEQEFQQRVFTTGGKKIYTAVEPLADTDPYDYRVFINGQEIISGQIQEGATK